ncbi:hypothetical protein ABZY20_00945 [Streptomyces sp. NPDC006624]
MCRPLVGYLSTALLLSQRYLAPLLLFLGLVAVLTGQAWPPPATPGRGAG